MPKPDIEISAFAWVPPFASGYVKDLRARWALEEAGLPYRIHLVAGDAGSGPDYRAWQPFGQVPAYRDGEVEFFESGAIVLRIAELSDALRPWDAQERAQVTAWVFAALNSVEPKVDNVVVPPLFHAGADWLPGWMKGAEQVCALRLRSVARWLDGKDWLVGDRFTVADLMLATVLRGLQGKPLLAEQPTLAAYLERCLDRPAFTRALNAQVDTHRQHAPVEAGT